MNLGTTSSSSPRRLAALGLLLAILPARAQAESEVPGETAWPSYRAHLAAAQAWLELNEAGRAYEWLDGAPREFRGWEWRWLQAQLDSSQGVLLTDEAGFMSLSVSPDGKQAACLAGSGRLQLVDLAKGTVVRAWDAHPDGGGFTVRFAPDGGRIASSGADRLVKVWDSSSGDLLQTFAQHKFPVGGLAWSPDGARIASSAYYMDQDTPIEGRVHIWQVADGSVVHTLRTGRKPVVCTDWSRDGRFVAAGTWDSEVVIWSADSGELIRSIDERPSQDSASHVDALAISPDGRLIAYGSDRKWVRVHRVDTGERVAELLDHGQPISALQFSPDGSLLASAGGDDAIRLWKTADWTAAGVRRAHRGRVRGLAFSPDGVQLYSASLDGEVRGWITNAAEVGGLRFAHTAGNYAVSISPDGTRVAGAGYDGALPIWDTGTGRLQASPSIHAPQPCCMTAWSPDGSRLATCSWDKTVRILDSDLKEVCRHELPAGVAFVDWSHSGELIAAACNDHKAYLLGQEKDSPVRSLDGHEAKLHEARFSPDGSRVATASNDRTARIWRVADGTCLAILQGHRGAVLSVSWSPDGSLLATSGQDGDVRLWNTEDGILKRVLHESDEAVYRVAFSPDGRRLACAARELILLDPAHAGAVARLRTHNDVIWNLDWSPDGGRLASASWDGTVTILTAPAGTGSGGTAPQRPVPRVP